MMAAGTDWKHYGFDALDGLISRMNEMDECIKIQWHDPSVLEAEEDLWRMMAKLESRINRDEYQDLELEILGYAGAVSNVSLLHGIRTGISLVYAINHPTEMSEYIVARDAQRRANSTVHSAKK